MPELNVYDVILRPIITEKSSIQASEQNQFAFEVAGKANKIQIKEAIEVIFDLEGRVEKVRTMVMPAKRAKRGRNWYIRTKQWKKAIVTLEPGATIELFNV